MSGGKNGQVGPPSDKGLEMFEMAQFDVYIPYVKKGGGTAFPVPLPLLTRRGYASSWEDMGVALHVVGDLVYPSRMGDKWPLE